MFTSWSRVRGRRGSRQIDRLRLVSLEDRITPAGQLDPTFGVGGLVTTRIPYDSHDEGGATAVDNLGRAIVAGYTSNGSNIDFAVSRYTAAGALDASFGGTGFVTIDFGASDDYGYSVIVDSQNRVIVGGRTYNGSNYDFAVVRLIATGVLDASFDSDGKQTFAFGASDEGATGVAVDSQDRVIVVGYTHNGSNRDFAVARLTAAGALDLGFDSDGKQTFAFGTADDTASNVAVDSQDRVLIAGFTNMGGSNVDFAVARLTPAGSLDGSFDIDGKQTFDFGASNEAAFSVAVDSLDRVVVAGYTSIGSNSNFAVARFTTAGVFDPDFDSDGKLTISFGVSNDRGYDVAVDSLDRVVVAGYTYNGSNNDFAVARLTAAGAIDSSIDVDGKQTIAFGASHDYGYGVAIDSQNRAVISGRTSNGTDFDFAVSRLTATGALDASFNSDGKQTTAFLAATFATGRTIAVDREGRTLVAGSAFNGSNDDFAIARYTTIGTLDTSFGGTGIVTVDFGGPGGDDAYGVAVDSLNRVVIAGYTSNGLNLDFAVARLTTAGTLDSSFDDDGKLIITFGASHDYGYGVAVDSQDRVVVAGYTYIGSGTEMAVARLTATGALDANFDSDGKQTISFGPYGATATAVAVDSQDRVVVAGYAMYGYSDVAVARLTAAGALDSSFDADGKQTFAFGAASDYARAVAVDSQDRVVVAGSTDDGSKYDFAVARLTVAGTLDSGFDADGKQTVGVSALNDVASGVAVDSADRVLVVGFPYKGSYSPNTEIAVVRLTVAGTLDSTFDTDGKQLIAVGTATDVLSGVAVDLAGRVVIVGQVEGNGLQFALARLTGDAATAIVQVNDASAQHSMVISLKVTFSEPVMFPSGINSAFQLQRTGPGGPIGLVNLDLALSGNVVTVTFNDPTFAPGMAKSLVDGIYKLTLIADKIQSTGGMLDGNFDGVPGGDLTFQSHRLFGDSNGDGRVNNDDLAAFRSAFGTPSPVFDFNNDGVVNAIDFAQFRARYGVMI